MTSIEAVCRLYYQAMLVSITSTTPDATDLGWLLHKHPDRVRTVDVAFGQAHVFYPEATPERCTATLLVDVDPVAARPWPAPAPSARIWWSGRSISR